MAETNESVETIKTASDGTVKIAIEKYNELLEEIASQKGSINSLRMQLHQARAEPPMINRTVISKTPEMLARERRLWGGSFMGLGASLFLVGAVQFMAGRARS